MICPASSSTMKSRTFSQISASVRGSSVPSVEYDEISSWMRSASGSKASRVCMGLLVERAHFLSRRSDGLAHTRRSGAARNVMNGKHVIKFHETVKICAEIRIDTLQFSQCELLQLASLVQCRPHCFPD